MTIPRYEYKCRKCYGVIRTTRRGDMIVCSCGGLAYRRFGFQYSKPLTEHYNLTTGSYIRTPKQFNTSLKRMSEEASVRTGIEHTFQPIDPTEPSSHGVTEQGLYEQQKHWHDTDMSPRELIIP